MAGSFQTSLTELKAVAEPTRLRLLALLAQGELTVGELCEIVSQSQPRISRHLKILTEAGLLDRFREQAWVYYRTPPAGEGRVRVQQILALVDPDDAVFQRDRRRLTAVLDARSRSAAESSAPAALPPEVDRILLESLAAAPIGALLDVGTGSGHVLGLLASRATRAVGIDISSDALRVARTHVHGAGLSHCELQHGDMYDLPFGARLFDTAIVDRVLASAQRPVAALDEIGRTLTAAGRLIVVEDFDALADQAARPSAPANPIAILQGWFAQAGFECGRLHPIDTERGLLIVAVACRLATVPAAA